MTVAAEAVARVTETVPYLRLIVGQENDDRLWYRCASLVSDPSAFVELARSTAVGRGTEDDRVALSLFVQGYAYRIASAAIGAWILGDVVVDVSPLRTAIEIDRHRPSTVRFDRVLAVPGDDTVGVLHANLIDGHLALLLGMRSAGIRIGPALLWSNLGAACASVFGAFMSPLPDRQSEIRARADNFFARARPELAASGRLVHVGASWAWERASCCLWKETQQGSLCADCVLWSDEERKQRYDAAIANQINREAGQLAKGNA